MKIRNGFVSNSSASSFVIKWRYLKSNLSLENTLRCTDLDIDYIQKNTKEISDGVFCTDFFTTLLNSMLDFGEGCAFYTIIKHDNNIEVISSEVVGRDMDWDLTNEKN